VGVRTKKLFDSLEYSSKNFFALKGDYRRNTRDCKGVHMTTNPGRDTLETQQ
jgi:hypothetical protein